MAKATLQNIFDKVTEHSKEIADVSQSVDEVAADVLDMKGEVRSVSDRMIVAETQLEERTGRGEPTGAAVTPPKTPSIVPATSSRPTLKIVQLYLPWILIALAAIGSWLTVSNGNGHDPEQLDRAVEKTEDTQKAVEALRMLLESVAEHPPASFEVGSSVDPQD